MMNPAIAPAVPRSPSFVLDAALNRRSELHASTDGLSQALSMPYAGREDAWLRTSNQALRLLRQDIEEHIATTESDSGIHQEIISLEPRLANMVSRLTADHEALLERTSMMAVLFHTAQTKPMDICVAALRDEGKVVVDLLTRHRQRGADLVYEAYAFDIGGRD